MTVYKPISILAARAAEIAVELGSDESPETNAVLNNGTKDVPSWLLKPIAVNKNNIKKTVVADSFHSENAIYQ
jgi:D-xylose transport system substrate-binding protein